jgi:DHA1 family tetracycline resistance protein-like MFS transporter
MDDRGVEVGRSVARPLAALSMVVFVSMLGYGLLFPVLPFLGIRLGASPTLITVALSVYALGQLVAAPLWGRLGDRIGRRRVLIWTALLEVAALLVLATCTTIEALIIVRFISGLFAGNIGAAYAYVADVTQPQTRAKAIGWVGSAVGLGFILGPGLGGLIATSTSPEDGFVRVALAAAGIQAVAAICAYEFLPESLTNASAAAKSDWRTLAKRVVNGGSELRRLLYISFLVSAALALLEGTFTLWAASKLGWGPTDVGLLFVVMGLVAIGVQGLLVGRLVSYFGETAVLVFGSVILTIGMAVLSRAEDPISCYVAVAVLEAGLGLVGPTLASLTTTRAEADVVAW